MLAIDLSISPARCALPPEPDDAKFSVRGLALAKAIMLEPELLCIDELSLGLAPVVVQDLLQVVERLKEQGTTMVIVEQSVNVALSIADRAVFMERVQVKFEGPAKELLERGDLLRAVFLSGAGA